MTEHKSQHSSSPSDSIPVLGHPSDAEIEHAHNLLSEKALFAAIQDSLDAYVMVLNPQSRIVAVNRKMQEDLKISNPTQYLGALPGAIIGCINALEDSASCGANEVCKSCGVTQAIRECLGQNEMVEKAWTTTVQKAGELALFDFRLRATPVRDGMHQFVLLLIQAGSETTSREALERAFYHDVLNMIGGLLGWSKMLREHEAADAGQIVDRIWNLANRLCSEVLDQRRLSQAQKGDLLICIEQVPLREIFQDLRDLFYAYEEADDRILEMQEPESDEKISTDPALLLRILINMLKNAIEATQPGDTIRVWRQWQGNSVRFCVHNPGEIPQEIATQIFHRPFTTKTSTGHGIGTFSMKLFGERYLKGKVSFDTDARRGTTFAIEVPQPDCDDEPEEDDIAGNAKT